MNVYKYLCNIHTYRHFAKVSKSHVYQQSFSLSLYGGKKKSCKLNLAKIMEAEIHKSYSLNEKEFYLFTISIIYK